MFSTLLEGMTTAGEKEEYTQIRESVRALCADFPGEYWRELDKVEEYPTEFVKAMTDSGFLSVLIPEEYGGSGLGLKAATVVLEEVHRSGCNAGAAHAQMYTMGSILHSGSDEQKERYLPDIAAGNLRLQAFGVSEPNSGTDTLSLETKAEQDANGDWLISGSKMWTSRAEHSDLMLLLARTGDGTGPRGKQLTTFLVDMRDQPGMEIKPVKTMMNHSSTAVFFDNVKVPKENVIGGVSNGFKTILKGMNAERVLIASECIGDGRYFVDKATAYSNERVVFGRPIGQNQGVQFPVAQAYCELEAAALMVNQAAEKFDRGEDIGAEANISKHLAAEASFKCGDVCIQTYGGFGFAREYDIERKFRETRLYRVAPISTNLVLSFVGEKLLGMPRSY
jgi:acyl-CoA dehydrogenase